MIFPKQIIYLFRKIIISKKESKCLSNSIICMYIYMCIIIELHTAAAAAIAAAASRPALSAAPWPGRPRAPPTGLVGASLLLPLYVVLFLYIYIYALFCIMIFSKILRKGNSNMFIRFVFFSCCDVSTAFYN